jgi:hypothetical protein
VDLNLPLAFGKFVTIIVRLSSVVGLSELRAGLMIFWALEKHLSDDVDVAGMRRIFRETWYNAR